VNVFELQRQWRSEYKTEHLTLLKILKIRNKIETVNVMEGVYKQRSGISRSSPSGEISDVVL
jgi:hypothetical protein